MAESVTLIKRIIEEQELVIGPLAWREAKKVQGLKIDEKKHISLSGTSVQVLARLVEQYEQLFGPASREVCKDAVRNLIPEFPSNEVPDVLK
jgi:hypothetical protein